MSMLPMNSLHARAATRVAGLILPLALLASCTVSDAEERSHTGQTQAAEGDIGRDAWSPVSLNEVKNVPIAELRTAVQQRLGGQQPGSVGDEAWQHTKRLYARFQQTPLWFERGGLDKDRVKALTSALLQASNDGL